MAKLALSLGLAVILHLAATGQVDTLRLEEIQSIFCPDRIIRILRADVNQDGIEEIIVPNALRIYVYNAFTGDDIWTSPDIPGSDYAQIEFHDVNNDSVLEIICLSPGYYFYIFNISQDQPIWISPQRVTAYGIGDRNSDGYQDIFLTNNCDSYQYDNVDSNYIDVYEGPNFQFAQRDTFILNGYPTIYDVHEYPTGVILADISGDQGIERKLIMFTEVFRHSYFNDGMDYYEWSNYDGNVRIMDPINFDNEIRIDSLEIPIGEPLIISNNGQSYIYSYTYGQNDYMLNGSLQERSAKYQIKGLSASGLVSSVLVWNYHNSSPQTWWSGAIIGDFDLSNEGYEICYGAQDSLKMFSYPGMTPLWSVRVDSIAYSAVNQFHSNLLFNSPQILCVRPLKAFDGTTGILSSVFPNDTLQPAMVYDLDHDGQDELISYSNPYYYGGILQVYHAVSSRVGIHADQSEVPNRFHLYPPYPNPFNPSTTIQYDLVKDSPVNIGIYDILGQRIETLINQKQPAGHHQVIWNATDASSGIYFYKIQAGDYAETKKMVVMK